MADAPSDFDKMFRELQREYLASLPERLIATRASVTKARTESDAAAADFARDAFHKLRGTGTSFGLPDVTDAAAKGENALIELKKNPAADVWSEIEDALKTLEAAVARGV